MVYYGLGRIAARSFVSGLAGSVGRRVGGYRRRRRRTRWPSRATNVKRTRTFVKKERRQRGTRSVRRLWRAVKALQRTSDPDVTISDIAPTTITIDNNYNGYVVGSQFSFSTFMANNLALGDQYKIKSFNQQLTMRLRIRSTASGTDTSITSQFSMARHVRVLYILCKDELLPNGISSVFDGFGTGANPSSSIDTIYPQFVQNPGITYRILYDRTYTVRSGTPTQVFVRVPSSVFYDKGTVKFREVNGVMVQQNNYLYRFIIADSITPTQFQGTLTNGDPLHIEVVQQQRWKFYDFGRTFTTALSASTYPGGVADPSRSEGEATVSNKDLAA